MKKKKIIILSAVNALLITLIVVSLFTIRNYRRELQSQQASEFWRGKSEERFSQVSCFFPESAAISENKILTFRGLIDTKLTDAGVKLPTEHSLWTDAYSAAETLEVTGERGTAKATAIGIGGNYFMFHPYELLSGSYLYDTDVMKDRVVLDYDLAWKLFGSSSLDGMYVKIGGKPYYVAGVIKRESDKFTDRAFSGEPVIFMSYTAFSAETTAPAKDNTAASDGASNIACYEICMPDPISEFAATLVKENLAADNSGIIVENSGRYGFERIVKLFTNFGDRSISNTGVEYPYWENAARVSEVYIARLYVVIALLAVFPLGCIIWLLVLLIKFLRPKLKKAKAEAAYAWDDRYARMDQLKKRRQKHGGRHTRGRHGINTVINEEDE